MATKNLAISRLNLEEVIKWLSNNIMAGTAYNFEQYRNNDKYVINGWIESAEVEYQLGKDLLRSIECDCVTWVPEESDILNYFEQAIRNTISTKERGHNISHVIPAPYGMTESHFEEIKSRFENRGFKHLKWIRSQSLMRTEHHISITFDLVS